MFIQMKFMRIRNTYGNHNIWWIQKINLKLQSLFGETEQHRGGIDRARTCHWNGPWTAFKMATMEEWPAGNTPTNIAIIIRPHHSYQKFLIYNSTIYWHWFTLTPGLKDSPSVPKISWHIPLLPLSSALGVGPKFGHQLSGNLEVFMLTSNYHEYLLLYFEFPLNSSTWVYSSMLYFPLLIFHHDLDPLVPWSNFTTSFLFNT